MGISEGGGCLMRLGAEMQAETASARRTKAAIRAAFMGLLEHESLRDLTVRKVIDAADVGRSTFYRHYASLYEVLGDCIYQIAGTADKRIPEADSYQDFLSQTWTTMRDAYASIRDNMELFSFAIKGLRFSLNSMEHMRILEDHSHVYYEGMVNCLEKLPPCLLERTLAQLSSSMIAYWIENGFAEPPERIADLTVEAFDALINVNPIPIGQSSAE